MCIRDRLPEARVVLFGDRIHLAVPDAAAATRRVAEELATAGLALGSTRVVTPSLEDVFVAVLATPPP